MNRNRIVLTLAVVAMATLAFTATSANAVIIGELGVLDDSANGGINPNTGAAWAPGDTYRLAFHTSLKRDTLSTDINDYNAFVQSVAAGSTAFPHLGNGTWKVLGSTETVSARQNTGTDTNVEVPILAMDGLTVIAEDSDDMWDGWDNNGNTIRIDTGDINTSPHYSPWLNEEGGGDTGVVHGVSVATGSNPNGTIRTAFGRADRVNWGSTNANRTGRVWVRWDSGNPASNWSFYGLSDPLFVGELPDPLFWQAATSGNWAAPMWTTTPGTPENLVPTERTEMTIDQADTVVTVNSAVDLAASVDVGASTNSQLVVADTFALEVSGAVRVGAAGALTVNGGLTTGSLNSAGTVSIGANGSVSAGSGSVASVSLAGDATVSVTDSTLAVALFTGSGGTLTKQGAGTLSAKSITAGATTDFNVSQGTFEVAGSEPLGNKPVVLAGGKLRILSPDALVIDNPGFEDPVLADGDWNYSMDDQGWGYFDNDGYIGSWNVATADFPGEAPEGENVGWAEGEGLLGGFAQVLTDPDATLKADMIYTLSVEVGYALSTDPFGGYMVQLLAGGTPHTPGTGADYTGPVTGGTLLAEDDNLLTIAQGTFETSTVTYTYDPAHSALLGEPLQIRLLAYAASDEVEFDAVYLTEVPSGKDAPNFSGVDLTVTENSTLDIAIPLVDATFKSLTMQSGTFTTMGTAASIDLTATTFADGSEALGFNTRVPTLLGPTTADGVTPLVVTKTGTSDLVLNGTGTGLDSTTFDVQEGRLIAAATADKGNPLTGAVLQVGGGEIVLAGPTTDGAVTYDNQVNVTDDGTLTAGPGGNGTTGVQVTVGSAAKAAGVNITSGVVAMQATDGYSMVVAGDVTGAGGGISAPDGPVTLAAAVDVGSVDVSGGQLTTAGATVGDLRISGGVLATSADLNVVDATVSGGTFAFDNDSSMVVSNSLNISGVTYSISDAKATFKATGSDMLSQATLTLDGDKLTIAGPRSYPEGAVGIWTFDDGNDLGHDSSGNDHHGILQGDPSDVPGKVGGAIELDGNGDYVEIPYPDDFNFTDAVSVGVWINVAAFDTTWQAIVAKGEGNRWRLHRHSNDPYLNWNASGSLDSTTRPTIGQWHHLVAVHNEAHELLLYVDGVLDAGPLTGAAMGTSASSVMIGENPDAMGREFNGLIDDVCIYDRGLTLDDVDALYNDGNGPSSVEQVSQTSTNLLVTANAEIASDATSVTLGNLTIEAGVTELTLTGDEFSLADVTTGPTATLTLIAEPPPAPRKGSLFIRGVVSPGGNDPGLLTVDGAFELGDFAEYACDLADWNEDTNPDPWNENPPLVVNDKITITGNLDAYLAGTLTLRATSKLRVAGQGEQQWYGDQTRTIMDTVGESTISDLGAFLHVPAPGTHLGHGVFATDQGANGQVVTQTFTTVKVDLYQAQKGDANGDHVIDTGDMMLVFGNWTLLPPPDHVPRDWPEGNFSFFPPEDANTTIETGDMMEVFGNWTLPVKDAGDAKDGDPQIADLLYYPATGDVQLDPSEAAGEVITIFRLMNDPGEPDFNAPGEANFPWPLPDFLAVDTPLEIANTDLSGSGISGVWSLGAIFPTGLDQDQLEAFLTVATYVGSRGTGVHRLDLIVIPEPGTVVMLLTGALGLLLLTIRRRRSRSAASAAGANAFGER